MKNTSICGNYRGLSLLSNTFKILTEVRVNHLVNQITYNTSTIIIADDIGLLPEVQCGFRSEYGTAIIIFTAC